MCAGRRDDGWALPASRPGTADGGGLGPATNGAAGGNSAAVAQYVRPLAEELERKRALFMDDASFITEVREGRALAPGMDAEAELRTLRLRFDNFRRDFKVRHWIVVSPQWNCQHPSIILFQGALKKLLIVPPVCSGGCMNTRDSSFLRPFCMIG